MSQINIKALLMPHVAAILSSDRLKSIRHFVAELKAKLSGKWPVIDVYLHVNDPYSFILLQALPELAERFNIEMKLHWLSDLQTDMFPEPEKLQSYAYKDAQYLAELYGFTPLPTQVNNTGNQLLWSCQLQAISDQSQLSNNEINELAQSSLAILKRYWEGVNEPKHDWTKAESNQLQATLKHNSEKQKQHGHYLAATIHFAGEWYWGVDRLDHLEKRLNLLGLNNGLDNIKYDKTWNLTELSDSAYFSLPEQGTDNSKTLTLYWSARSPYSYLALMRSAALAEKYQLKLIIKPVMPMMMRNMLVPETKKMYIFHDTKREAQKWGIPYGKVADPLGEAVKRCYAILDYARNEGKYLHFLLSFARAVNTEGIRAETDKGLQLIVERAGLSWHRARQETGNESWQAETTANLAEITRHGFWGVPVIQYQNIMHWGQDRLGRIEAEIRKHSRRSSLEKELTQRDPGKSRNLTLPGKHQ